MDKDIFEKTKNQIVQVQTWIAQYNLKHELLRKNSDSYVPPSTYFTLRNQYESLRINKLRLIRRKNQIESKVSGN
jgi:hypothetical protein